MDPATPTAVRDCYRVLVLKRDRFYGELLAKRVHAAIPGADCMVVGTLHDAGKALRSMPCDLLIAGIGLPDGDVFGLLALPRAKRPFRRALLVTAVLPWTKLCLRQVELDGVLDSAHTTPDEFEAAIRRVAEGGRPAGTPPASGEFLPRRPDIALHSILIYENQISRISSHLGRVGFARWPADNILACAIGRFGRIGATRRRDPGRRYCGCGGQG